MSLTPGRYGSRVLRAAALVFVFLGVASCGRISGKPRNVVLICMDTVRFDTFWLPEAVGWDDSFKPWAERGLRFQDSHSTSSWTIPAVASAFSGLYPLQHRTGLFEARNANLDVMPPSAMPGDITTLAEVLKAGGYRTAAVNSSPWLEADTGILQGFDEKQLVRTGDVAAKADEWFREAKRSPYSFFLYLHFMDAHGDKSKKEKMTIAAGLKPQVREILLRTAPGKVCVNQGSEECVRYLEYVHSVMRQRRHLARVLESLERRDLLSTTTVILFSDHGEEFSDHLVEQRVRASDPRQTYGYGHGQSLYGELLHVPVVVWHPTLKGSIQSIRLSLADLFPSILGWIGIEAKGPVAGKDLSSLKGEKDRPIYASGIGYGPEQIAVLWNQWKRIEYSCPRMAETFQIDQDPLERQPAARTRLDQRFAQYVTQYKETASSLKLTATQLTPEQMAALKSIGYLQGGVVSPQVERSDCGNERTTNETIGLFDPKSRVFFLRLSNSTGVGDLSVQVGIPEGDRPLTGDWDGDSAATVGVYDTASGTFHLFSRNSSKYPAVEITLDVVCDGEQVPVAGDWDGDGRDSVGVYCVASSTFYLRNSLTSGQTDKVVTFGSPNDRPVIGDWNGDKRIDLGVYRASEGTFHLMSEGKVQTIAFGIAGDLPLAADWDGDGKDTIGVFRPGLATFFLRNSNVPGDADLSFAYGNSTMIPVAGRWAR